MVPHSIGASTGEETARPPPSGPPARQRAAAPRPLARLARAAGQASWTVEISAAPPRPAGQPGLKDLQCERSESEDERVGEDVSGWALRPRQCASECASMALSKRGPLGSRAPGALPLSIRSSFEPPSQQIVRWSSTCCPRSAARSHTSGGATRAVRRFGDHSVARERARSSAIGCAALTREVLQQLGKLEN